MGKAELDADMDRALSAVATRRTDPPRLMTSRELALALRIHPGTVRKLHREGAIRAMRFGPRTYRYDWGTVIEDLKHYMAAP